MKKRRAIREGWVVNTPPNALQDLDLVGGHPAVDFVNTVHSWRAEPPPDYLRDFDDFVDWNVAIGLLRPESAVHFKAAPARSKVRVFKEVRELRDGLYRVLTAVTNSDALPEKALDHLNDIIRRSTAWRQLAADEMSRRTAFRSVWNFTDAPAAAALGPVAWLAADLLENGPLERVKECPGENCGWLFIDASKNRSRNWCSMKTCGNAAKVKRFRQRAS